MVRGAAWSVPLVTVAAPAAYAGPSQCTVVGSVQVGPLVPMTVRAICTAQSQFLNPGTLMANYASGSLPAYLEICNCQNADAELASGWLALALLPSWLRSNRWL
mgnify:CR=1 FL=1